MALTVKLTTIGNSTGIVLPKELLERMHVQKGDLLHVLEVPGGISLTPLNPELAQQMDVAEGVMRRRRNLLSKLAE